MRDERRVLRGGMDALRVAWSGRTVLFALVLAGCTASGPNASACSADNEPPVADAGPPVEVESLGVIVWLDGSASSDASFAGAKATDRAVVVEAISNREGEHAAHPLS